MEKALCRMPRTNLLLVVCFAAVCGLVRSLVPEDEVFDLPGLTTTPKFRQFSGYLKATGSRLLHYWFVESQGDPAKDPLVLWLNGGPGCSSLDGFLSEHGPFLVSDDGHTLVQNPYSWNKVANVIYMEAPAGVGFSYSSDKNYTTSDDQVSLDNYWALKYFLSRYPEFANNDFYITGESYGGIYVPTLSVRIAEDKSFKFKGFAVGNGLSDYDMNFDSLVYFAYNHGLISNKEWLAIVEACCPEANSTIGNCQFSNPVSHDCQEAVSVMSVIDMLNVYSLYAECYPGPSTEADVIHPHQLFLPLRPLGLHKMLASNSSLKLSPPCINATAITNYLNIPAVRKALHIPESLPKWEICSYLHYEQQYNTMKNQYVNILSLGRQRIMVYNGDTDMACNFLGDEWFVNSLNLKVKAARSPWFYTATDGSKQIAGFTQMFNNLTFVTVKGAGHMVPQEKPLQALEMFKNFLSGVF